MRTRILVGLVIVASAATASCANEQVLEPTPSLKATALELASHGELPPCVEESCNQQGRMTGGGGQHVVVGDIYVTRGYTVHCDITLSNNLEINWPGNKWHLDKPLTGAVCINDPNVAPEPPDAPFDTFIGEGIGRLNGVDGSLVQFIFVDAGEPSGRGDKALIKVYDPNGVLVLSIPLSALDNGNNQAHYDQPHGNKP